MTAANPAEARRERRRAAHQKYNLSAKGQARNARYEAKHPERKLRWEPARNARPSAQNESEK
jgi:hypothetical protein